VVNSVTPPLGLATLAAVLDTHAFEAEIIDAAAEELGIPAILARIGTDAAMIGLSATTPEIDRVAEVAQELRRHRPNATILLGGVHPTLFHESLVRDGVCDMVVRGEGEAAVLALAKQSPLDTIPGLTWRAADGSVVINPPATGYVVLDELPFPSYQKLPMRFYRSALGAAKRSPSIGLITSRGCPGTCTFCYSGMFGQKIRFMSAERVLEHMLFLKHTYGIREISFYDDTFTANRKRIEKLCELLLSGNAQLSWSCFARVDTVEPALLALMKKAGCHQIGFGFESADENILKAINKRIGTSDINRAVSWTREAGLDIRGAFMIGNPGETEESVNRTIEYSKKLGIQYAVYNITTPFPGTELSRWAGEQGFVKHTQWGLYDLAHPILELPTISSDAVLKAYQRAYREFYLRPSYILRRLASIRTREDFLTYANAFRGILSMLRKESEKDA